MPGETPETTPNTGSTVATPGLELLHTPPATVLLREVLPPTQTVLLPVIAVGALPTTTSTLEEALQPAALVAVKLYTPESAKLAMMAGGFCTAEV